MAVVPWRSLQDHSHWVWIQWMPFVTPPLKARDIIGNTLMYVPLGYLSARGASGLAHLWRILAFAAALSLLTEATQLLSHRRFPSSTDLVCNLFGAFVGVRLAMRAGRVSRMPAEVRGDAT